ncbi:hypothetical protein BF95_10715 [Sphingobium sp. Ant17]|nr:hypothetical protein BF95_10715 [Sphingobium sp. Ant17]
MSSPVRHHAKRRLSGIQVGRGIAALAVVLTHSIVHPYPGIFQAAHLFGLYGVTLFFVISGYIMVISTGDKTFRPGIFIRNRLRRIVPLYWAVIFITALLSLILPTIFRTTEFSLPLIIKSMLFIPYYSPGDGTITPFVKLGWTLNFEMFFYVCFAVTYALTGSARAILLSVFFISLVLLGLFINSDNVYFKFYTRIDILGFVAGVWLAVMAGKTQSLAKSHLVIMGLISLAIGVGLLVLNSLIPKSSWTQVGLIAVCAMQVAFLAESPRFGWSIPRFFEVAGDASYSVYLFHMFGVGIGTIALFKIFPGLPVLGIALSVILGTAVGIMVYHLLEAPMDKWVRRVTSNGR